MTSVISRSCDSRRPGRRCCANAPAERGQTPGGPPCIRARLTQRHVVGHGHHPPVTGPEVPAHDGDVLAFVQRPTEGRVLVRDRHVVAARA